MPRLRVCQLITELAPGGAERVVYELSRRLDKDRFDVQVVALRGGQVEEWFREAGVPVTVVGVRGKWDFLKLGALADVLRRERIDLLHTHLFHADLAGRLAAHLAGVPRLVHTVHTAEGRFRPWQFAFARFFGSRCDRVICVSRGVLDWHRRRSGLPEWRYAVIPNGVDVEAFSFDADARRRLRAEWGLADDEVLSVYAGRLHREKGIDVLLGAFSHLSARGNPHKLVIAGQGPEQDMVRNFMSHGEGGTLCRWLGFTRCIRDVLSAADMFVMPSRWEGWGLAMGEAMAVGLPVIGTNVPGLRELIHHEETGLLVEREDIAALAEAIDRLSRDTALRRRLAEAGRRLIRENFTIEETVSAHARLYLEVTADQPRS